MACGYGSETRHLSPATGNTTSVGATRCAACARGKVDADLDAASPCEPCASGRTAVASKRYPTRYTSCVPCVPRGALIREEGGRGARGAGARGGLRETRVAYSRAAPIKPPWRTCRSQVSQCRNY